MDELTITTWLWGNKYGIDDVVKLRAGLERHLKQPFDFVLVTSEAIPPLKGVRQVPISDRGLTLTKGCFARLRMFDPLWQEQNNLKGRIVCLDLDTILTGPLDPVFDRPESFVILHGANSLNPCKFCGALQLLRAGAHPEIWSTFGLEAASRVPFHDFPDDQGWLWHSLPDAAGWRAGENGVYAFCKPGWHGGYAAPLPKDARLVTFNGWRSPARFHSLPWIREHWR
jgi:hypothetical protein